MPVIEDSVLFRVLNERRAEIPAAPAVLEAVFLELREYVQQQSKYIVNVFPEYTPHDAPKHLNNLFHIADRVLGHKLYAQLNASELLVLACSIFSHDWGMAVSNDERAVLEGKAANADRFAMLKDEPRAFQERRAQSKEVGADEFFREYARRTHGDRSGARITKHLSDTSVVFANSVAKAAAGHTYPMRRIRDPEEFPWTLSVFGLPVNLAALASYVRIVDLLDIGEDRTPFALWKFIDPKDRVSQGEWRKHRALSAVSVEPTQVGRRVVISGVADDPGLLAALHDLETWVQQEFSDAIAVLQTMPDKYQINLDSRIAWSVKAIGFEASKFRFEVQREPVLSLLAAELYGENKYAFVRELLQNSIDAVDARRQVVAKQGLGLPRPTIDVSFESVDNVIRLTWRDSGIGMDLGILGNFFARVGRSWYRSEEFSNLGLTLDPISRFGIGILSCFSVSPCVSLFTRREPSATSDPSGYSVVIPSRDAHFRVQTRDGLPVGTSIVLEIPAATPGFSIDGCVRALETSSGYCEHVVSVKIGDQASRQLPSYAFVENVDKLGPFAKNPGVVLRGEDDGQASLITRELAVYTLRIGSAKASHEGFYSIALPQSFEKLRSTGHRTWQLGDLPFSCESPEDWDRNEFYVRGVRLEDRRGGSGNDWFGPSITVNFKRPSDLVVNLARDRTEALTEALAPVWLELGPALRGLPPFRRPRDPAKRADIVGAMIELGRFPSRFLDSFWPPDEWPCLVLRNRRGLEWTRLGEFLAREDCVVAPRQLAYCIDRHFTNASEMKWKWFGPDCIVPLRPPLSSGYLWRHAVHVAHERLLTHRAGPSSLHFVFGGAGDPIPLTLERFSLDTSTSVLDKPGSKNEFLGLLGDLAPGVAAFGPPFEHLACMGSEYWNSDNLKIQKLLSALDALAKKVAAHEVPSSVEREVRFRTSHSHVGYLVPSRQTRKPLGMDVANFLLEICRQQGIAEEEPLSSADFVPGTLGVYENPYHYELGDWPKARELGCEFAWKESRSSPVLASAAMTAPRSRRTRRRS